MKMGTYQGKKLPITEVEALENFEKIAGQPIKAVDFIRKKYIDKKTGEERTLIQKGFIVRDGHVVELQLPIWERAINEKGKEMSYSDPGMEKIVNLTHLEVLDLSGCLRFQIPYYFYKLKSLKILYLTSCWFSFLEDYIGLFANLEELYLDSNELKEWTIPETIFALKKLKLLDITENDCLGVCDFHLCNVLEQLGVEVKYPEHYESLRDEVKNYINPRPFFKEFLKNG